MPDSLSVPKFFLKRNNAVADCRSILEVLLLGTVKGNNMEIVADGDDETEAVELVSEIFLDGAGI
ncbi:MAG: HPr family phosphocarrier protein [Fibrobacter sp.]|nr:HPr family phosphocarrier protein [Fibrobacter sp.]